MYYIIHAQDLALIILLKLQFCVFVILNNPWNKLYTMRVITDLVMLIGVEPLRGLSVSREAHTQTETRRRRTRGIKGFLLDEIYK